MTRRVRRQFPELIELYDNTASLQDRTVGTGVVSAALAAQFAAPGFVGRASGRSFDARLALPYAPYDAVPIEIAVRTEGDVDARVWVRIREIRHSIGLARGSARLASTWARALAGRHRDPCERRRLGPRRGVSGRHSRVRAHRSRRAHRALPLTRSVMVSVAAARGCHRGQHRCGLSLVQQIVQLLLFRARSCNATFRLVTHHAKTPVQEPLH